MLAYNSVYKRKGTYFQEGEEGKTLGWGGEGKGLLTYDFFSIKKITIFLHDIFEYLIRYSKI